MNNILFSCSIYLGFFMFACGIYFVLIGPILFNFWIIPKIEKRLHGKIKIDSNCYFLSFPHWFAPAFEISLYMWNPSGYKNPRKGTYAYALKNLNYDTKDFTRIETVVMYLSMFLYVGLFFSGFLLFIYFNIHPQHSHLK